MRSAATLSRARPPSRCHAVARVARSIISPRRRVVKVRISPRPRGLPLAPHPSPRGRDWEPFSSNDDARCRVHQSPACVKVLRDTPRATVRVRLPMLTACFSRRAGLSWPRKQASSPHGRWLQIGQDHVEAILRGSVQQLEASWRNRRDLARGRAAERWDAGVGRPRTAPPTSYPVPRAIIGCEARKPGM